MFFFFCQSGHKAKKRSAVKFCFVQHKSYQFTGAELRAYYNLNIFKKYLKREVVLPPSYRKSICLILICLFIVNNLATCSHIRYSLITTIIYFLSLYSIPRRDHYKSSDFRFKLGKEVLQFEIIIFFENDYRPIFFESKNISIRMRLYVF